MDKFFIFGQLPGTTMNRYATLDHGCIVSVSVSRPEGQEVPRPAVLRWRHAKTDVQVKEYLFNNPAPMVKGNGEQPRRPVWSRAGKRAAPQ